MANEAGIGAFASGLAGGYATGKNTQNVMSTPQQSGLGLPGQTTSATGAAGLPQTQPQAAQPSTPDAKAASQSGGAWSTLAGYLNPPTQQG